MLVGVITAMAQLSIKRMHMIKITREDVLKLAHISNISISEEELPALMNKLSAVLSYAEHLKDIAGRQQGQPLPVQSNITRQDVVIWTDPEPLLALAPAREENFYVVPMILKN
jgi:aspartyl-tRNA(Asn)/glutamyl-tRNA(Gln) amidotransferase subunit C